MPSDNESKSKESADKGKSESQMTKAIAAVFATVIAPVLVAMGMKFSDVIVAPFQQKPAESAKSESDKTEPSKDKGGPAPDEGDAKKSGSNSSSDDLKEHKGQFAERGNRPTVADSQATAGFTALFNGSDLSGWRTVGSDTSRWSVDARSNAIVGNAPSGKKQGNWLYADKDFSAFQLRCEFRLEPGAESGIALRSPFVFNVKEGRIVIHLTSVASDPIANGTLVTVSGGNAHPQSDPKAAVSLRPAKEWNTVEVEFRGPQLKATINGQQVQDVRVDQLAGTDKAAGLRSKTGRIALECRSGHVEFRRIEIQELDSAGGK
jgi:hypothetical protein